MQRITEQTQQEMTIQNLVEINRKLTEHVERFKPSFEISYDDALDRINIVMKLNGKTVSTSITKEAMEYYPVKDQTAGASEHLLDPFRALIVEMITGPVAILNKNVSNPGATL